MCWGRTHKSTCRGHSAAQADLLRNLLQANQHNIQAAPAAKSPPLHTNKQKQALTSSLPAMHAVAGCMHCTWSPWPHTASMACKRATGQ